MRIAQIAPLHERVPPRLYGGTERVVSFLTESTEPDMRARIRLFGLIDQNASESWLDTCGWLISFQRLADHEARLNG